MHLRTLYSTSQTLSVIIVERKKTKGENGVLNAKSCCSISKHWSKWVIVVSCLQLPHPAETSQNNCATPVQGSVFPTLSSQNPTQLYTEARHNYPTATSQAKPSSFSKVSASTNRHWCTMLPVISSAELAKTARTAKRETSLWHPHEAVPYPKDW